MKLKQMFMPLTGLVLISLASPSNALAATPGKPVRQYTRTFTVDAVGFLPVPQPVVVEVPTMGVVELMGCHTSPSFAMHTSVTSFEDAQLFSVVGAVSGGNSPGGPFVSDQTGGTLDHGGGQFLAIQGSGDPSQTVGHWEWSLWREDGDNTPGAHVSIDGWNNAISGECHFRATVSQND